jgi:hypothetical protein
MTGTGVGQGLPGAHPLRRDRLHLLRDRRGARAARRSLSSLLPRHRGCAGCPRRSRALRHGRVHGGGCRGRHRPAGVRHRRWRHRLIPLTGITLPFVSYGGTSLVATFILLGLLLHAGDEGTGFETEMQITSTDLGTLGRLRTGSRLANVGDALALMLVARREPDLDPGGAGARTQQPPGQHAQSRRRGPAGARIDRHARRSRARRVGAFRSAASSTTRVSAGHARAHTSATTPPATDAPASRPRRTMSWRALASSATWSDVSRMPPDSRCVAATSCSPSTPRSSGPPSSAGRSPRRDRRARPPHGSGARVRLDARRTIPLDRLTTGTPCPERRAPLARSRAAVAASAWIHLQDRDAHRRAGFRVATPTSTYEGPARLEIGGAPVTNYGGAGYGRSTCARRRCARSTRSSPKSPSTSAQSGWSHRPRLRFQQRHRIRAAGATSLMPVRRDDAWETAWAGSASPWASTRAHPGPQSTVMQMALVAAGIANDGVVMRPYVVSEIADETGESVVTRTRVRQLSVGTGRRRPPSRSRASWSTPCGRLGNPRADPGCRGRRQDRDRRDGPGPAHRRVVHRVRAGRRPGGRVAVLIEEGGVGGQVAAPAARRVLEAALAAQGASSDD